MVLSKKTIDEVGSHLFPIDFDSIYLNSMIERRARAFAAWCMRGEEGLPPPQPATAVDRIFDEVASGEVVQKWTKQRREMALKDQSH